MKMFYDKDCDLKELEGCQVAVIGYGSQGHAHALNLKESGVSVVVGLYEGSSSKVKAEAAGLRVLSVSEAVKQSDVVMMLIPDEKQRDVYESEVKEHLEAGNALVFAHGFNIHYGQITPPEFVDVFMVAPKGPGHLVRRVYEDGKGVPALIAVHQDYTKKAFSKGLAYAKGIGATRAGVIETTFKEETETDLFGEQAVLCGGVTELVKAGFDIPKDVFTTLASYHDISLYEKLDFDQVSLEKIEAVAQIICEAKKPIIYAGGGIKIAEASEALMSLASKCQMPVSNTLMGLGTFPRDHTLSLGLVGMHGFPESNMVMSKSDLITAIGARFSDRVTGNTKAFLKTVA